MGGETTGRGSSPWQLRLLRDGGCWVAARAGWARPALLDSGLCVQVPPSKVHLDVPAPPGNHVPGWAQQASRPPSLPPLVVALIVPCHPAGAIPVILGFVLVCPAGLGLLCPLRLCCSQHFYLLQGETPIPRSLSWLPTRSITVLREQRVWLIAAKSKH